jgi:hypothetical protein
MERDHVLRTGEVVVTTWFKKFVRVTAGIVCVAISASVLVVLQSVSPVASSAEAAGNCLGWTNHRYPGSTPSRLRFGDVTMTFAGCGGTPSGWSLQPDRVTNGTGSRLGYEVNYARVENSTIGNYYRFWNVVIGLRQCLLKICGQVAEWRIKHYAYYVEGKLYLTQYDAVYTKGDPLSYALFTTP